MRRREFIAGTGLAAISALAGCSSSSSPPPRKSNVIQNVETQSGKLRIDLESNTWVMSRYDSGGQEALADPDVGDVNPVGSARAKGKGGGGGRGATGRGTGGYSSAPRTRHGRAWYLGGDYADDWYEDHGDEVTRYGVTVAAIGVAYLGSDFEFEDQKPEPGAVPWDRKFSNPDDVETYSLDNGTGSGWYRVGAHVVEEGGGHDFRWESVDLEIDRIGSGYEIDEKWKVSPRV